MNRYPGGRCRNPVMIGSGQKTPFVQMSGVPTTPGGCSESGNSLGGSRVRTRSRVRSNEPCQLRGLTNTNCVNRFSLYVSCGSGARHIARSGRTMVGHTEKQLRALSGFVQRRRMDRPASRTGQKVLLGPSVSRPRNEKRACGLDRHANERRQDQHLFITL